MSSFLEKYFAGHQEVLQAFLADAENRRNLEAAIQLLRETKQTGAFIYVIGNGGSASLAEHSAIDFTQNSKLRSLAISGSPMLTAWSNDYGYEHVFRKGVESFGKAGDVLIGISSSGTSKSILNACEAARRRRMAIVTFSGFAADNPLRTQGDLNFWINSRAFGYVEMIHHLLLHYINDAIIGKVEYLIRD